MNKQPINIIRDPQKKCCATCHHAHLVSCGPYEPLIAECHNRPNPYSKRHPYVRMVANAQCCRQHQWRKGEPVIEQRSKNDHAA